MLTHLTYTPTSEAEAAILPCLPDHLRRQVLAEQARLLEMARSIEKASAGEAGPGEAGGAKVRILFAKPEREEATTGVIRA